ncbi:MAG: chitobiase/beta-hexosaminidase C-terminal domain-containing protein, partial [Paludibacteraceae bacterium]|nr:chitobiase/beta-hexosaminidase C-terminal domain-containing protein [Paludibacteraceae bacterium]
GSLTLLYGENSLQIEDNQFAMPAADVTVTGEFEGRSPYATIDFTDVANEWGLPESYAVDEQSFTYDGLTITLVGTGAPEKAGGYKWSKRAGGHLLLGNKNAMLQLPMFSECEVAKIVTNGTDGASGLVEMNVFVGDKAVSTKTVGSKTQNTYLIGAADRGLGTRYDLVILNDNTAQFSYIDIYATVPGAPEAPEMSVKAGIYKEAQTVALSCVTEGASIYFTLDSSRPTEKLELLYTTPIVIEKDQTKMIRAIAVKDGIKSEISSATYVIADVAADGTLDNPYSVADVHKLGNPGWKAWVHGFVVNGFDTKTHELSDAATNAIAIADAPDELDKANMSFVELTLGKERDELNVVSHPENVGKEVWVYGVLSKYGNQPGVSKVTKHYLDELPEPEVPTGVESVERAEMNVQKVLLDGRLYIIRNGEWYNATGVRVQ